MPIHLSLFTNPGPRGPAQAKILATSIGILVRTVTALKYYTLKAYFLVNSPTSHSLKILSFSYLTYKTHFYLWKKNHITKS